MKCWVLLIIAASAQNPQFCGPKDKNSQLEDSGHFKFNCRAIQGTTKHPHWTKRCKVQCYGDERGILVL